MFTPNKGLMIPASFHVSWSDIHEETEAELAHMDGIEPADAYHSLSSEYRK